MTIQTYADTSENTLPKVLTAITNQKIVQSNELITSVVKMDRIPLKYFEIAVASLDINNIPEDRTVYLDKELLYSYFNLSSTARNNRLKDALLQLHKQSTFHISSNGTNSPNIVISPFEKTEWNDFDNSVAIRFTPAIMPYLVELKKNFTQYQLADISKLNSRHAIILFKHFCMNYNKYEHYMHDAKMCGKFEDFKSPVMSVDELRRITSTQKEYELFANFRKRVIEVAVKEVSLFTSLNVTFKTIKTGRKVTDIQFFIERKDLREMNVAPNVFYKEEQEDIVFLKSQELAEEQRVNLLTKARTSPYTLMLMKREFIPYDAIADEDLLVNLQTFLYPHYDQLIKESQDKEIVETHLRHVKAYMCDYSHRNIVNYMITCVKDYLSKMDYTQLER